MTAPAHSRSPSDLYRGQYRQDEIVDRILGAKRGGVFVDVGAHDGVSLSNTYFFEKVRGWSGVCFEPNPTVYARLRANRSCICENMGVAARADTMPYLKVTGYAEMGSGLVESYDRRHLRRIEREIAQHGGSTEQINIPVTNLSAYLIDHGLTTIDYCSIDVEGGELDIVQSVDFDRLQIRILSIENNFWDQKLRTFMRGKGFTLLRAVQTDDIYGLVGSVPRSLVRESLLVLSGSLSLAGRILERRLWG